MASPFAGWWHLYGRDNVDALTESLGLPKEFRQAIKNVRFCEEIKVEGEHVKLNMYIPSYKVPAHFKDINFAFGVEREQALPFGRKGKGTVNKESEHKWVAKLACNEGSCTVTRELVNNEMWVTIEGNGVKCVRKFKRAFDYIRCVTWPKNCTSPFQGPWRLYHSENLDKYLEALGVPAHWRNVFTNVVIGESIHVNGNDVHIRICVPEVVIPARVREFSFQFGKESEYPLPFGHSGRATGQKVSNTKWQAKLNSTLTQGDATLTRELVGDEMWVTLEAKGKRVMHKFVRVQCNK